MNTATTPSSPHSLKEHMPNTVEDLNALEATLRPYIQNYIYMLHLFHWKGKEREMTDDVLHETYLRAIPYIRNAENGTIPPIMSLEALCKTIAKRYLLDLRRKDKRLIISIDATPSFNRHQYVDTCVDPVELASESMVQYSKMLMIAQVVKGFSPKLKEAILVHFANMADFDDEQPRPLERAMQAVDIHLSKYRRELPSDPVLRSRHAALVCLGIKNLRQTLGYCKDQAA